MLNFKITSTVVFLAFFQCWEEISGEQLPCGDLTFDPKTQRCTTNGVAVGPDCKIGHCLKNDACVPKQGNACDIECPEGAIISIGGGCFCFGAKTGDNCDEDVPSNDKCFQCTDQQICTGDNPPCWFDVAVCDLVECQNGGTCSGTSQEEYKCTCAEGYYGRHCETKAKRFGC